MDIRIYKNIDSKLLKSWSVLWESAKDANYFNSPQWFAAACEAYHYDDYLLICYFEKGVLKGILPLVRKRKFMIFVYCVAGGFTSGNVFLTDSNDEITYLLLENAVSYAGNIFLEDITGIDLNEYIKNSNFNPKHILSSKNYILNFNFQQDHGAFLIRLKKDLIGQVKRYENDFVLKMYEGYSEKVFNTIINIDENSTKKLYGYNTFSNSETINFFKKLAKKYKSIFTAHILYSDTDAVAYNIGFSLNKTYYANQTAFRFAYKRFSPGKILAYKIISQLHKETYKIIDLGAGEGYLKEKITSDFTDLYTLFIARRGLTSTYLMFLFRLKKYLYERLSKNERIYKLYRKFLSKNIFMKYKG